MTGVDWTGKTETKPESEFEHLSHSGNTQDLKAADPHVTSTMEGLHARHLHEAPEGEQAFGTSVMKSDYRPGKRSALILFFSSPFQSFSLCKRCCCIDITDITYYLFHRICKAINRHVAS